MASNSLFGINSGGVVKNINGYDYVNNKTLTNYPAIEVPMTSGSGTLNWKFLDNSGNSEGKTFTISNFALYNIVPQGNQNTLDLGDYFSTYSIRFNALPKVSLTPSSNCPLSSVDTDSDGVVDRYEIPPTKNCITISFSNLDGVSYSPEYSFDGSTYSSLDYTVTVDKTSTVRAGSSSVESVYVREFIDSNQTIQDSAVRNFSLYRDKDNTGSTSLLGKCVDTTSNTTQDNLTDLSLCSFVDPGTNSSAGTISINGSSAPYGNCRVLAYKNGNYSSTVIDQAVPCNSVSATYTVPASDKGQGDVTLEFYIAKEYNDGNNIVFVRVDRITFTYNVNSSPFTNN